MQNNPDKPWDWCCLSINPSVATWDIVQKYPNKPWDWLCLSWNPCVATWDIVQKYPNKPWDWTGLCGNPSVVTSWDIMKNNPEKPWRWYGLSKNPMTLGRKKYIQDQLFQRFTQWFIKSDLKRELMENRWHPRNMEKWPGWGFEEEYMEEYMEE